MNNLIFVQDSVLKECIKAHVPVTVFLVNGFQFKGIITNFDANVVLIEVNEKQQMIYKHAISTIVLSKRVHISPTNA